jgi:hypothetical protein
VVKHSSVKMDVLGSNLQGTNFLTIKTTSIVDKGDMWAKPDTWVQAHMGQGDIWAQLDTCVQADMWAEFESTLEIEFEFEFRLELEYQLG